MCALKNLSRLKLFEKMLHILRKAAIISPKYAYFANNVQQ